jgi:hypothetical protein
MLRVFKVTVWDVNGGHQEYSICAKDDTQARTKAIKLDGKVWRGKTTVDYCEIVRVTDLDG